MKTPQPPKGSGWHETPLRGAKLINVVIDPYNRFVATCSDKECLLFDVKTSERQFCIEHDSTLVGCYFTSPNEIVTIDGCGVMRKWCLADSDDASLISTVNLNKKALYVREEGGSVVAVVSEKKETSLCLVHENGDMEKLCDLQKNWTHSSFSISSKLVAVCQGKRIRVIARAKEAKIPESFYESRFHVDYLKESNDMNVFESVHVTSDTVAAALTIGRIFIWCDVSTLGVNRSTQSVHWHKSAPVMALSSFGGIFSGGGECVLCKWKLGKGAPCMLPRLSSPIRQLSLSVDGSLIALLLDDNSVVMIDTAAMGVQTRLPTLSISTRSKERPLMEWDPMESDMVVVGGREGCLQWIHPATSTSPFIMDVGLENGVDRDLPIYGVTQSFHSVYLSRFSRDHVVTVEEKAMGVDKSRVRVWERVNSGCSFNLLFSQEMGTRIVDVSLRSSTASNPFFLLTDSNGRTMVLRKSPTGFHMDSKRDFSWKGAPFRCASRISEDGLWAVGYSVSSLANAIVVVDVNEMRVTEVLKVSGEVMSVDWSHSNLIASCTSGVYAWSSTTFLLRWRVAERCSLKYHPVLVAWIDRKIMVIDESNGTVKESMVSTGPIEDVVPFHHGDSYGILVNHSGNSFSVLLSSEIRIPRRRVRSIRMSTVETVPSSIPQSVIHSSSCLSGPVHMLPPLSLVAPSFIQSCLLPTPSLSGSTRGMEHFIPEISWHDRASLLSIDIDDRDNGDDRYRIVTSSMQKEIRMWELVFEPWLDGKTPELIVNFIANIVGHQHSINTVQFHTFNNARYLASGDSEGRLIIWNLSDQPCGPPADDAELPPNKENWVRQKMIHHDSDVTCLAWQPNGPKLASVGRDNNLLIHDVTNGKRVLSVYNLREFPNGISWDPLGRYLISQSTDRKMEIIDAAKGTKLRLIYAVDFPPLIFSSHTTDPRPTKLFYDDQMMSFKRLPSFSPCGQLVVVPCAHIESREKNFYGNYVFKRREALSSGKPSWILPSPKATFFVKMCPVVMALDENTKENYSGLPHRVIWLSLTDQAIIFYDSQHCGPIAYVDNIHYLKLTDASWSRDGKLVAVSSMEGYCSFLRLSIEQWGVKLTSVPSFEASPEKVKKAKVSKRKLSTNPPVQSSPIPPTPKTPSLLKFFGKTTPLQKQTNGDNKTQSERPQKRIKLITLE